MEQKRNRMDEQSGIDTNRKNTNVNESSYGDLSKNPSREHQGGRRDKGNLGESSGNVGSDSESGISSESDFDTESPSRR